MWKFFHEGEKENDMICELCPNGKVIRKQPNSTWNLIRHMRRKHANELKGFIGERLLVDNWCTDYHGTEEGRNKCTFKIDSATLCVICLICKNGRNYSMFLLCPHLRRLKSHENCITILSLLQSINDVSKRTPTAWEKSKSLAWNFFCEGENVSEMICQLCPTQTIIRKRGNTTSNLLKHVKRFHLADLKIVQAESKQPAMEKMV